VLAAVPNAELVAILWHQGEYEASAHNPSAHRQNLINVIAGFREGITGADENTPFIFGGLAPEFVSSGGFSDTQAMLQRFPEYVAYTDFASSADLTTHDGVHFNAADYRTLGSRYEDALIAAVTNVPEGPSAVQNLDATPDDGAMALDWDVPTDIGGRPTTDYVVRYRQTGAGDWAIFADGAGTATSTTITDLTNGTSYDFQVAALNAAGEGATAETTATPSVPVEPLEVLTFDSDDQADLNAAAASFSDLVVADGMVILAVLNGNFNAASAVTIGGVEASFIGIATENNFSRSLWIAEGIEGPTADVEITFSGSTGNVAIAAWSLPDTVTAESDIAIYNDTTRGSEGDHPYEYTVEAPVQNGGAILAWLGGFSAGAPSDGDFTWLGVTQRLAAQQIGGAGGIYYGGADHIARIIKGNFTAPASGAGLAVVVIDP
jgi:hypothetical protein